MKRVILSSVVIFLIMTFTAHSQDLLKEPSCACDDATLVVSLGGTLKLDYKETNISTMDDGSVLLQDKVSGNFYIVREGVTQGPFQAGDPKIAGFEDPGEEMNKEQLLLRYKNYLSKPGDKYLISFGGKTYGPYGDINSFTITKSKDKFAAMVVENVVVNEMDGKAMDEAMKNAKTDQERMQLAMKYSQQMQQKMMSGGGPATMTPKLVSNIPDATFNISSQFGASPNGKMKFDDILLVAYDKIYNLQGKQVIALKSQHIGSETIFVNTSNTAYVTYNYGTLMFSDGKSLTDLFNPHLIKTAGQVYLAYMYYSPKRNALMQCKIPF